MKTLFLFALVIGIASCTPAYYSVAYRGCQKQYRKALRIAAKSPSETKQPVELESAMDCMIAEQSALIQKYMAANDANKYKTALSINQGLQNKIQKVLPYTGNAYQEILATIRSEELDIRKDIAQAYFDNASYTLEQAIRTQRKALAEQAYYTFQKAREAGFDDPVIYERMESAFQFGQRHILIITQAPFQQLSEANRRFQALERKSSTFVHYHVNDVVEAALDCEIIISLAPMRIRENQRSSAQSYTKEVIDGYTINRDTCGNEIKTPTYRTITANVTTTTIEKSISAAVSAFTLSANQNCDFQCEGGSYSRIYSEEVIEVSGDERALPQNVSADDKYWLLPSDDDMIERALDNLYRSVECCL